MSLGAYVLVLQLHNNYSLHSVAQNSHGLCSWNLRVRNLVVAEDGLLCLFLSVWVSAGSLEGWGQGYSKGSFIYMSCGEFWLLT